MRTTGEAVNDGRYRDQALCDGRSRSGRGIRVAARSCCTKRLDRRTGRLLPKSSTDTGCHQPGPRDLDSVVHQRPLACIASNGGSYSLGYPAALRPLTFPVTPGPVDRKAADDQGDGAERDPQVGHTRSISAYTFRQGLAGRNLLIRRDLRARPLPAHAPLDLPRCCSLIRSYCRRYATLCGQYPAR